MSREQLNSIVSIRNWLKNYETQNRTSAARLEQFALDWIEDRVDRAIEILESEAIGTDDETFTGATHYEADTILEVLSTDANCYLFFQELTKLTKAQP